MDEGEIREAAARVLHFTRNAAATAGFWVGDRAGERRAKDAFASGRMAWTEAKRAALLALEALTRGDLALAEEHVRWAQWRELEARRLAMQPKEIRERLDAQPGRRGAPANADRDRRLAAAVAEQEAKGIFGTAARRNAFREHPELEDEFEGITDAGVRAALRRGRAETLSRPEERPDLISMEEFERFLQTGRTSD